MRIVRARIDAVGAPYPRPLFYRDPPATTNTAVVVTLEEAGGALGFGYAPTFGFGTAALRTLIDEDLAPLLAGIDLVAVDDGVRLMADAAGIAGRPAGMARQGIAILEMALWDLAGHLAGMALHALWGQPTGAVRAYASGGWRYLPVEDLAQRARSWARDGFKGVKLQVGLSPAEDLARLRSVRDAVGPEVQIMLDANQRIPADLVLEWGRALAPHHPAWLEEPIPADDHRRMALLRAASAIPIAGGESESEPSGLEDLLERDAVDVIQPDIHRAGLGAARAVRTRASQTSTSVSPHMAHEVSVHVLSGVAGDGWLEYFDWFEDWWESPVLPTAGHVTPATGTGHGLRLRPGWLEAHRI
jgi:L-alanine-DL-glutamate epimerase-like enolase superfamily enzyme